MSLSWLVVQGVFAQKYMSSTESFSCNLITAIISIIAAHNSVQPVLNTPDDNKSGEAGPSPALTPQVYTERDVMNTLLSAEEKLRATA